MKKGLSIFFLLYYLVFSFGFVVNKHFCKGELVSLEIMAPADGCCDDIENTCCSNDQDVIFLDDHNKSLQTVSVEQPVKTITQTLANRVNVYACELEKASWNSTSDPPPLRSISRVILNCSLVVYG